MMEKKEDGDEKCKRFKQKELQNTPNYKHGLLKFSSKNKKIIENNQEVNSNSLIISTMKCSKNEKDKSLLEDAY